MRWLLWLALLAASAPTADRGSGDLATLARAGQWQAIKTLGPSVLPRLAAIYADSSEAERAQIAYVFYNLGWKSDEAKRALLRDVHTSDQTLRVQVQWALGRVSDDPAVVDVLLANMQDDQNPLFRDKAACALASDQIHLTPHQKIRLYEGLIRALEDPKPDVRRIADLALTIQTHLNKGFAPDAPPEQRRPAVEAWKRWLDEYRAQY
jgi:HEAT repeat protein